MNNLTPDLQFEVANKVSNMENCTELALLLMECEYPEEQEYLVDTIALMNLEDEYDTAR